MSTRRKQQHRSAGQSKWDVHEAAQKWVRLPRHDHVEKRQTCAVDQPLGGWQPGKAERGISWSGWAQKIEPGWTITGSNRERSRVTKDWSPIAWIWTRSDSWWAAWELPPVKWQWRCRWPIARIISSAWITEERNKSAVGAISRSIASWSCSQAALGCMKAAAVYADASDSASYKKTERSSIQKPWR